jgi:hypothetical protein
MGRPRLARIFHSLHRRYDHFSALVSSDGGDRRICGLAASASEWFSTEKPRFNSDSHRSKSPGCEAPVARRRAPALQRLFRRAAACRHANFPCARGEATSACPTHRWPGDPPSPDLPPSLKLWRTRWRTGRKVIGNAAASPRTFSFLFQSLDGLSFQPSAFQFSGFQFSLRPGAPCLTPPAIGRFARAFWGTIFVLVEALGLA